MSSKVKEFDFSSVGNRLPQLRAQELTYNPTVKKRKVSYSPTLPLKLSGLPGELFTMNTSVKDAYSNNLINLLKTNRGERVMETGFGANLKAILSEYGTPGFEEEVMVRIKTAVGDYIPTITLTKMQIESLESNPEDGVEVVKIDVQYVYPGSRSPESVSVILSTIS